VHKTNTTVNTRHRRFLFFKLWFFFDITYFFLKIKFKILLIPSFPVLLAKTACIFDFFNLLP